MVENPEDVEELDFQRTEGATERPTMTNNR